jgi:hypothetical protein
VRSGRHCGNSGSFDSLECGKHNLQPRLIVQEKEECPEWTNGKYSRMRSERDACRNRTRRNERLGTRHLDESAATGGFEDHYYLATDGYKSTQSSSGKTCTEDRPRGYINSSEGR